MSRNTNNNITAPSSRFFKGPYGRMFQNLQAWAPHTTQQKTVEQKLLALAKKMKEDKRTLLQVEAAGGKILEKIDQLDKKYDNQNLPAGYTYFGQFIDHDITFDPASSLMRRNDPNVINNFRTPRLDLDSLYGGGPARSPHMFRVNKDNNFAKLDDKKFLYTVRLFKVETQDGRGRFVENKEFGFPYGGADSNGKLASIAEKIQSDGLGSKHTLVADLSRNCEGTAIIADPRNDENMIVSQLHLAFQLAHNALVDRAKDANRKAEEKGETLPYADTFEAASRVLRWSYQYVVWFDFVRRISHPKIFQRALKKKKTKGVKQWIAGFSYLYHWKNSPFIPVEFSVAAYRFGHSLVRNVYLTNKLRNSRNHTTIFGSISKDFDESENLKGGRKISVLQALQWDWFLHADTSEEGFPQKARKINTKLSEVLQALPKMPADPMQGPNRHLLAYRTLLRGYNFDLPSGRSVAKYLGLKPMKINHDEDSLWYYILKEAEDRQAKKPKAGKQDEVRQLGKVGSTIICSTFAGLLMGDPTSFFTSDPRWTPQSEPLIFDEDLGADGEFDLLSIIKISGLNPNSSDYANSESFWREL